MTASTLSPSPLLEERPPASIGRGYGRLWARVPRELGYLAVTAVIYLTLLSLLHIVVGGLLLGLVAVLVLGLLLLGARYLGAFELIRLRWAGTPPIPAPSRSRPFKGKTFGRAVTDLFGNAHSWLYGVHSYLLNPLLAAVTTAVWGTWLVLGVTLAAWPLLVPVLHDRTGLAQVLFGEQPWSAHAVLVDAAIMALGLLLLALFPFVTRGTVLTHHALARLLLARFPSEGLREDVARVDAARTAAIAAEDTALRRLERDIHDGPQQRLLRLQMELATAERRIEQDGDATDAIRSARLLAAEALDELRALAQGFAPPLLQDRGLAAALAALGRRGELPVEAAVDLPAALPDAVERSVYFVAAELVANAVKHGAATRIRLEARVLESELLLTVRDDGRGGVRAVVGHGLEGVERRLAGLGGSLEVDSPEGGPTAVTARVPLP